MSRQALIRRFDRQNRTGRYARLPIFARPSGFVDLDEKHGFFVLCTNEGKQFLPSDLKGPISIE